MAPKFNFTAKTISLVSLITLVFLLFCCNKKYITQPPEKGNWTSFNPGTKIDSIRPREKQSTDTWDASAMGNFCGPFALTKVGNSWNVALTGVAQIWYNSTTGVSYNLGWGSTCITLPSYNYYDPQYASLVIVAALNASIQDVRNALNAGTIPASGILTYWKTQVNTELNNLQYGSVFSTNTVCMGNVVVRPALYLHNGVCALLNKIT